MRDDDDVKDGARLGGGGWLDAALQVLAPNSLQFNEHEFQRCALLHSQWRTDARCTA